MRSDSEVIACVVFAIGGFWGAFLLSSIEVSDRFLNFFNPIATLMASFLGAWYAFKLQNNHKEKEDFKSKVAAGNSLLRAVYFRLNELFQYKRNIIKDYIVGDPFSIRAMPPFDESAFDVDFKSIDFLLAGDAYISVIELNMEIERYKGWVKLTNQRSDLLYGSIQRKMEAAGINQGDQVSAKVMIEIIGVRDFSTFSEMTDAHFEHLEMNIASLLVLKDSLRNSLQNECRGGRFIDFQIDDL